MCRFSAFGKAAFLFQRVTKKFFNFFEKHPAKSPPNSEYVKGVIPDSAQEPLRDP